MTLYRQRQSEYASRLHAFDEDTLRFKAAMASAQESRDSLTQQLEIARKVEAMRAKLFKQQYGSELNYMDAQVVRMRTERDYQDATNRFDEAQHFLNSTQADRQAFIDGWRRQELEELAKARADATAVGESLAKAVRMNDLVVLTAPEDGIVLEVAKRSVGSVLQEAEPLVTMVPTGTPLIAEVMINSADVGYTKLGDEVAMKVDAFPYQRHGLLQGRLRAVGEDFGLDECDGSVGAQLRTADPRRGPPQPGGAGRRRTPRPAGGNAPHPGHDADGGDQGRLPQRDFLFPLSDHARLRREHPRAVIIRHPSAIVRTAEMWP